MDQLHYPQKHKPAISIDWVYLYFLDIDYTCPFQIANNIKYLPQHLQMVCHTHWTLL